MPASLPFFSFTGMLLEGQVKRMEEGEDNWEVVLLGSSFLECLRGTRFRKNSTSCAASREAWNSAFGGLNSHVLALAGAATCRPLLALPVAP